MILLLVSDKSEFVEDDMDIEFRKFTDYNRGIMYEILKDAYSFDERCAICWDENWKQSDAFFFDNPDIADKYGFITCYKGEPYRIHMLGPEKQT